MKIKNINSEIIEIPDLNIKEGEIVRSGHVFAYLVGGPLHDKMIEILPNDNYLFLPVEGRLFKEQYLNSKMTTVIRDKFVRVFVHFDG